MKGSPLFGKRPVAIQCEVCAIYGEGQMSHRTVCRLVAKFRTGQLQLKDAACTGCRATFMSKDNIEKICNKLKKDAKFTVRLLAQMTNL